MTETILCKICNLNPVREGRQVCDVCLGFEQPVEEPAFTPKMGHCETCGASFEPYKNGKIDILTVCHTCLMKRKYGPDWTPGDKREKDRLRAAEHRRKVREAKADEKGCPIRYDHQYGQTRAKRADWSTVTIIFNDDDQAIYDRLVSEAKRERRTLDQQILFYCDVGLGM